jgi:translocation and assembly module TamB
MSRRNRILLNIAIGIVVFILAVAVALIRIVQTDRFREFAKREIVSNAEDATGGKVEVGSFDFDWSHMRAVVTGFVIHGNEPPDAAPFVRAPRMELDLRLLTSIHHLLDFTYLGIQNPQVDVMVLPDGRTNIPTPKETKQSNGPPLKPVVNLAIGHFELTNATLTFASAVQHLDVRGNGLQAQFFYSVQKQGYTGKVSFQPLYVVSGRNAPVTLTVILPIEIQSERIEFQNAGIITPQSSLQMSGSVDNLRDPRISAQVKAHIAMADVKNLADEALAVNARNVPSAIDIDVNAVVANDRIQVSGLRLDAGRSSIEASGTLKDSRGGGALRFNAKLDLDELGRLTAIAAATRGTVALNGTAKLDANSNYDVNGAVKTSALSFQHGAQRITGVDVASNLHFDPHNLDLSGLRIAAFGGVVQGDASLQDFARFQFRGALRALNLRNAAGTLGVKQFAYDGSISGRIEASGDLKAPAPARSIAANARLSITPGNRGIPMSGRLTANYDGAADSLVVQDSYVALPHTRLTINGSVGNQLNIALTTTDVKDLWTMGEPPVNLLGHQAALTGTVMGAVTAPRITGHLQARSFSVSGRAFDTLDVDADASQSGAAVRRAAITRGSMAAHFSAQVGLRNWRATPAQPVRLQATVRDGDLADVLALTGQHGKDYSGALAVNAQVNGTVGDPTGSADLSLMNGTLQGQPFDRIQANANLAHQLVTIPLATLDSGSSHVALTADYQHPADSFTTGRIRVHVQSNQVNLAQIRPLQQQRPNSRGTLELNTDVTGDLQPSNFLLTAVNGQFSARGLQLEGASYGDINLTARTGEQTVDYRLTSDFAGSNIQITGNTRLTRDYPSTVDGNIRGLPVERVLAAAHRTDVPAKGTLSGTLHFTGTKDRPEGNLDVDLANAVLYDEPIDHVRAKARYEAQNISLDQLEVAAGTSRIDLSAGFSHPRDNLNSGTIQFRVNSSNLDLARIHSVQLRRPKMSGRLQATADGSAEIRASEPRVLLQNLKANLAANQITAEGKNYGDFTLNADTANGRANFTLASNLGGASIEGRGTAELSADYPVDAQVSFRNVEWANLHGLFEAGSIGAPGFDIATDGQIGVQGPVLKTDNLRGSVQISRLEVSSKVASRNTVGKNTPSMPVTIKNQGPVSIALDRQTVRIEQAHFTSPQTDIQATGTASLKDKTLNLSLNSNTDLAALQSFDRDITSSGKVVLTATARGTFTQPTVNGRLQLNHVNFNSADLSNGIANANGEVVFNGNSAQISNLTAESGGGKLNVRGFASMTGSHRFGLHLTASNVRVRVQQGVSIAAEADVNLTGNTDNSALSGKVTITKVAYAPQTDLGAMLSRAAPPVDSSASSPFLENLKLDLQVVSSNALSVQTSLAQSVQGRADIRIGGTATHPGALGRVTLSEGKLTFFGNTYTVNSGTIGFYNPNRIEPILDMSLETNTKGVDVILQATGPVDNMKLSYTSDPPLQFTEIVNLLAAGKTPTSDPTLLANEPSQPPQGLQQIGESALVGKALADPLANRMQRVFGVTQLKIDPTFTSGSDLPQANLTLQQQITSNITFTYVSALDNANAQTIRVEMTLNPQWSATAMRDQNGIFSINLLYKKQLR